MRNKVVIAIAAGLLAVAAVAWYLASPAYAMSQLKDAAAQGDTAELEERIDFPKLRDSIKSQVRAMMMRELAKPEMKDNPFGALGAMMAMGMVDGMVDGMVSPEGMAITIEEGKMRRPSDAPAPEGEPVEWAIEREGLDKFIATPESPNGEPVPSMIFEREGLGWKLAGMKLPAEVLPTT